MRDGARKVYKLFLPLLGTLPSECGGSRGFCQEPEYLAGGFHFNFHNWVFLEEMGIS